MNKVQNALEGFAMSDSSRKGECIYTYKSENKAWRITKDCLSVLFFPIGIYRIVHSLLGRAIVSSSRRSNPPRWQRAVPLTRPFPPFKYIIHEKSIDVDGTKVSFFIVNRITEGGNKKWTMRALGNAEFAEQASNEQSFIQHLEETKSNGIVFNYPGVGRSDRWGSRSTMVKAYKAMLAMLEDKKNGIGAEEIELYAHSIGTGVQGEALKDHNFKSDIRYRVHFSRGLSSLQATVHHMICKPLGWLVCLMGWNFDATAAMENLRRKNIETHILQTVRANVPSGPLERGEGMRDQLPDRHDGVIPTAASLAEGLLAKEEIIQCPTIHFDGIRERHNEGFPETLRELARDPAVRR